LVGSPDRRFPPPWTVEEREEAFMVHDPTGQPLAYEGIDPD